MNTRSISTFCKDNNGSAIVMVLVGLAFLFTLVTTMYTVTISNMYMKHNDVKIKRNFYSAETVTEQMKAGLEDLASQVYSDIYQQSLSEVYERNMDPNDPSGTESQISKTNVIALQMNSQFLKTLRRKLRASDSDENHYNVNILMDMVDPALLISESNTEGVDVKWLREDYIPLSGDAHIMKEVSDSLSSRLILKDVYVRYTNPEDGAVSEIVTDFVVNAPTMGDTVGIPNLFDFAIIARESMMVTPRTDVVSNKNIYAGDNGLFISDGTWAASLTLGEGKYLVSKGPVSLQGLASGSAPAKLVTGQSSRFFADGIVLDNGEASFSGLAAVADDTVYSGAGKLSIDGGEYFGFGDSYVDESKSSAILINHPYAVLDAKDARGFVLAGRAFIGQSTDSTSFGKGKEALQVSGLSSGGISTQTAIPQDDQGVQVSGVPMDRSIAVKADQVAYLVPPECIGVKKAINSETGRDESEVLVGVNPVANVTMQDSGGGVYGLSLPINDYDTLKGNADFKIVDMETRLASLGGKSLSYFADSDRYSIRYVQNQYGQNMAYFYIYVNEDKQREFLSSAYGRSLQTVPYALGEATVGDFTADQLKRQRIEGKYFTFYTSDNSGAGNITLPPDTQTKGSYVAKDSTGVLMSYPGGNFTNTSLCESYKKRYQALCARLIDDPMKVSAESLKQDIFSNLIDKDKMNTILNDYGETVEDGRIAKFSMRDGGKDICYGIVTDVPFVYTGEGDQSKIRIIISLKDVTVKGNYSGFIISDNNIIFDHNGSITLDTIPADVAKVMITDTAVKGDEVIENTALSMIDCFLDKDDFLKLINSNTENPGEVLGKKEKDITNYSSMVHYENFQNR